MLMRLASWLGRHVRGWHALAGLLVFLVFGATVLPAQARLAESTSGGAGSPDTSLYYSADRLLQLAEAYGEEGRAAYLRARWGFDLAFPIAYGFFLTSASAWAFARSSSETSRWRLAPLVPLGAVVFDLLENTATSIVMLRFPASTGAVAALAGWLTLVKWLLVAASLGLVIYGPVRLRLRGARRD